VLWRPDASARISVEGCQFECRSAVTIVSVAETPNQAPATAILAGNTVVGDEAVRILLLPRPRQPLRFTTARNVFDTGQLAMLIGVRTPRQGELPQSNEMIDHLRSFVQWSDEANVYRRLCRYVTCTTFQRPAVEHTVKLDGLADWLKVWNLPPGTSIEGNIRFHERAGASRHQPLRLREVDRASGSIPPDVGANPENVGPAARRNADPAGS
jgi:hypothetical protein